MRQPSGLIIVLAGPSGVGKGTLCARLLKQFPGLQGSVSVTTRPKRPQEQEGIDYYFVNHTEFDRMVAAEELVEWAEFAGNCYGTPKAHLQKTLDAGNAMLLEIEVQGALQIRKLFGERAFLIFVAPPSLEALEARLRGRNTNDEADIQRRLGWAETELSLQDEFDSVIINDNLDVAEVALKALILRRGRASAEAGSEQ